MSGNGLAKVVYTETTFGNIASTGEFSVTGACVVASSWGPPSPTLVSTAEGLRKLFTPNGIFELGQSSTLNEADRYLKQASPLLIQRADNGAKYGGCFIRRKGATKPNGSLERGLANLDNYSLQTLDGRAMPSPTTMSNWESNGSFSKVQINENFYVNSLTGDEVRFSGSLPEEIVPEDAYFLVKFDDPLKEGNDFVGFTKTKDDALQNKNLILFSEPDIASAFVMNDTIELESSGEEKILTILHKYPSGRRDVVVRITPYEDDKYRVQRPGCFMVDVFIKNTLRESQLFSRTKSMVDGMQIPIYIEEANKRMSYIQILDNTEIPEDEMPPAIMEGIGLMNGSDGQAIDNGAMIQALNKIKKFSTIKPRIVFDSGWCTKEYAQAIQAFAVERFLAFFVSAPYDLSISDTAVSDLIEYKREKAVLTSDLGMLLTPHFKVRDEDTARSLYISSSGDIAGKCAKYWALNGSHVPFAGDTYGAVDVEGVSRVFDTTDVTMSEADELYNAGISPTIFTSGKGFRFWSNKTCHEESSEKMWFNVTGWRLGAKPAITEYLQSFCFRLNHLENDTTTTMELRASLNLFFQGEVDRGALLKYEVLIPENAYDAGQRKLRVKGRVCVTPDIEWIHFELGLTSSGVEFSLLESAN